MDGQDVGQRQQYHVAIVDSIQRLKRNIRDLEELCADIAGEPKQLPKEGETVSATKPAPMPLAEFLQGGAEALQALGDRLNEIHQRLRGLLF